MRNIKKEALLDKFLEHHPDVSLDTWSTREERALKNYAKQEGYRVKGFGSDIQGHSNKSGAAYTRTLLKRRGFFNQADGQDADSFSASGSSYAEPSYSGSSSSPAQMLAFGLVLLVLIGVFKLAGGLFTGAKNLFHTADGFLSNKYEAELFTYEGEKYLGNQRFNKPDGLCLRYGDPDGYAIAEFDGDVIKGYGLVSARSGRMLDLGYFKKSKLSGVGVHQYGDSFYVANFKKGVPKGVGYRYTNGEEQLIRYRSVKDDDYAGHYKVIAVRQGDEWITDKGKALTVRNGAYKGIEYLREGYIRFGDTELYFDGTAGGLVDFDNGSVRLSWCDDTCDYATLDENGALLFLLTYDKDGSVYGQYSYKKGLQRYTFGYDATVSGH